MTLPRYEYKCRKCFGILRTNIRADQTFCYCGGIAFRRYGFSYSKSLAEHWNATTGTFIRTHQQFTTHLKRLSDETSIRTGIEHTFQPITSSTPSAHGVTEQGIYETNRHLHDNNISPKELIIP